MKPKVFVTRAIPQLDRLQDVCTVDLWQEELPPPYPTLLERVRGVDGLLCMLTDRIDAALMDAAGSQLKVISQMAVGYDNVDVKAAQARGIALGNTPGVLTETTADLAFTLLLAAARRDRRGCPLHRSWQVDHVAPDDPARSRRHRRDARHRRLGTHRTSSGKTRRRF